VSMSSSQISYLLVVQQASGIDLFNGMGGMGGMGGPSAQKTLQSETNEDEENKPGRTEYRCTESI